MRMYIGLDVHCKETKYVAQEKSGRVISEGSVSTSLEGLFEMLDSLHAPEGTRIGLETGTQATWVSRLLSDLGMTPVVIDAREVRRKARRIGQKCDRRDAFEICDGLRRGIYTSIVYIPSPEVERLRRVLSRRRHFVKVCTAEVNSAKHLLRCVGLRKEAASLVSWGAWERLLQRPAVECLREHLTSNAEVWRVAHDKVLALEEELKKAAAPLQETINLLRTAPGVGIITAATFVAVLGTPERFPDSSHVSSYVGLAPSTYDSGDRQRHGPITKRGSVELRVALCEAAQHARSVRHPLTPYFRRISATHGYKKAVVAVARRLSGILFAMWRKREVFDVQKLNVVADHHSVKRTMHWRIRQPQQHRVVA